MFEDNNEIRDVIYSIKIRNPKCINLHRRILIMMLYGFVSTSYAGMNALFGGASNLTEVKYDSNVYKFSEELD